MPDKTNKDLINEIKKLKQQYNALKASYEKDIAEREKAEEALLENEAKFSILFDENPLPTILSEMPSGKIAFVNKRMALVMGMNAKEIIGKTANELGLLKNPDDLKKLTELIANKGYVDNVEVDKILPEGGQGIDQVCMRLITINKKLYCLTIIQDISEQKQIEAELRKSEERYRQLIETTDTSYVIIDKKGIVLDANMEYVRLSGHKNSMIL